MYAKKTITEIHIKSVEQTVGGCPTIFDFTDHEGTRYYFRLRHGGARIVCEDTDETLAGGQMRGFDGVCLWEDAKTWAATHDILLKE